MGLDIICAGYSMCMRYSGYEMIIMMWCEAIIKYFENNKEKIRNKKIKRDVEEFIKKIENYKNFRKEYFTYYIRYSHIFLMFRLDGFHILMTHSGTDGEISSNDAKKILITYSIIRKEYDSINEFDDGEFLYGTDYTDNFLAICYISCITKEKIIYT